MVGAAEVTSLDCRKAGDRLRDGLFDLLREDVGRFQ